MEKRYQIFVSSTFADLQEERQAVMLALLSLDHFPAGMELFPASDDDQWSLIKGVIDDSDYYVLVIGGRYGSRDQTGVSYTEKEFSYALEKGIPVLAFIHENPDDIPSGKTDKNDALRDQLKKFIDRVKSSGRHVKFWNGADDLKAKVILAIAAETKRNPREGWIRASLASDPALVETLRQQVEQLRTELSSQKVAPPEGADNYEGGEKTFNVHMSYWDGTARETKITRVEVTWDHIFFEVGPILMEEASERQMQNRLSEELWRYSSKKFDKPSQFKLMNESFDTIKVQLVALGLIRKGAKRHVPSDTNRYWSLTPFGENKLMTLRAIKKQKSQ